MSTIKFLIEVVVYICLCKSVTDSQINQAIADGYANRVALMNHLSVGTGCGRCLEMVDTMLDEEFSAKTKTEPRMFIPSPA